ncbi:hypothetical protein MTR67_052781 [Solanum verrucosum]|uniref:Reverse transcriptase zinc-binding domain-containing protein n=1 Tax=Solanum verrucosum TaxID=315347 RepID=A0AAF0V9U1_SOLVR|nr:hypothetical protein MTR67_052781 [Solanum verrucosum]
MGPEVEKTCSVCQMQKESREHLFVHCTYVRRLWDRILRWMNYPKYSAATWEQHIQWTISNAKEKSKKAQMFKMMYAEITYGIWNERNQRIFKKRKQPWETIAKEIIYVSCSPGPDIRPRAPSRSVVLMMGRGGTRRVEAVNLPSQPLRPSLLSEDHEDLHGLVDSDPQLVVTKSRPRPTSRSVVPFTVRKGGRAKGEKEGTNPNLAKFPPVLAPKSKDFSMEFVTRFRFLASRSRLDRFMISSLAESVVSPHSPRTIVMSIFSVFSVL